MSEVPLYNRLWRCCARWRRGEHGVGMCLGPYGGPVGDISAHISAALLTCADMCQHPADMLTLSHGLV